MTDLIKIEERDGIETVNARDLHEYLGVGKDFSTWIKERIEKYEFEPFIDFSPELGKSTGGRPTMEYYISIDMAKELSMVENNEKGREARKYFIAREKQAKQLESTMKLPNFNNPAEAARAWANMYEQKTIAVNEYKKSEKKVIKLEPKADFYDQITESKSAVEMSLVAKVLDCDMGRNQLFLFLQKEKILRENNEPYQEYCTRGWFRVTLNKFEDSTGKQRTYSKTMVYPKGMAGISKLIKESGDIGGLYER